MKDFGIQLVDNNDEGELMDIKIQPIRDAQGKILSGFVHGNILEQNKALILIAHQGEFKFNPDLGVGISDLILGNDYQEFRHIIREHFAKDGLKVTTLDLYKDKPINIIANYET